MGMQKGISPNIIKTAIVGSKSCNAVVRAVAQSLLRVAGS